MFTKLYSIVDSFVQRDAEQRKAIAFFLRCTRSATNRSKEAVTDVRPKLTIHCSAYTVRWKEGPVSRCRVITSSRSSSSNDVKESP